MVAIDARAAALRRRHLHAGGLRFAGHRGQPRGAALLRRGRGLLAQTRTPSGAAWWPSSPGRSGYSIIDAKAIGSFMPPVFPGVKADSIGRLAAGPASDLRPCRRPVERSTPPAAPAASTTDPRWRRHTEGVDPVKSNWALPLDTPPFYGFASGPASPSPTSALKVDETARSISAAGSAQPVRRRRGDGGQRARQATPPAWA